MISVAASWRRLDERLLEVLDELYEPLDTLKAKNRMIARATHGWVLQQIPN